MSTLDRYRSGYRVKSNGCWEWAGALNEDGYARFTDEHGQSKYVHRWAKEHFTGEPAPEGCVADHTCHKEPCPGGRTCPHRRCVNPDHIAWVPRADNSQRSSTSWDSSHAQTDRMLKAHRDRLALEKLKNFRI